MIASPKESLWDIATKKQIIQMKKKLYRNEQEKMIAGVCEGLAEYLDIDVTWIRIAFVVAVLAGFSGILAYIILWIALPPKPYTLNSGQFNADYKVYDNKSYANNPVADPNQPVNPNQIKKSNNGSIIAGLILILFGSFFLLNEFDYIPYWFDFGKLWPFVFIIPGILMVVKAGKKENRNTSSSTSTIKEENKTNPDQPASTQL